MGSVALLLVALAATADEPAQRTGVLETGSKDPYVHVIALYDHEGRVIDPTDSPARPYSPRMTCGKCHDYETVSGGWHFNAHRRESDGGRPGEPWLIVDASAKRAIRGFYLASPVTQTLKEADLTPWQFTLRFARHLPGGGISEEAATGESDPNARWAMSGPLQIDCMLCHDAGGRHSHPEHARQIELQNFKWAATAAMGLAVINQSAKDLEEPDEDAMLDPAYEGPEGLDFEYDRSHFDDDNRVHFDITRRMPNANCYACHTNRMVGDGAPAHWQTDNDVHMALGMLCVDCHRNGLDHQITRGFVPVEAEPAASDARAQLTCAGCHEAGRLGAPQPKHRGLPPIHLEKMTCTACHSGPWPGASTNRVQTSMAHGLGIAEQDRSADDLPLIHAPVFERDPDGRIQSRRLTRLNQGDDQSDTPDALAYLTWPLAHDVRPAAESLGINGCTDCHSPGAPIYTGGIEGRLTSMAELHTPDAGDRRIASLWALAFPQRDLVKVIFTLCFVIVVGCGVVRSVGVATWASMPNRANLTVMADRSWRRWVGPSMCWLGLGLLAATGLPFLVSDVSVGGLWLAGHMVGAGLLIVGLAERAWGWPLGMWAAMWASPWRWAAALALSVSLTTAMIGFYPLLPSEAYHLLFEIHGYAGLIAVLGAVCYVAIRMTRRPDNGK